MSFVPAITLSQALTDPQLFGEICAAPSFWTWRTVAKVVDGEALTEPREIIGSTTPNLWALMSAASRASEPTRRRSR